MVGLLMFLQCILCFELLPTVFTGDNFLCLAVVDFQGHGCCECFSTSCALDLLSLFVYFVHVDLHFSMVICSKLAPFNFAGHLEPPSMLHLLMTFHGSL